MSEEVKQIYSILLARDYATQLFQDLQGQKAEGRHNRRASCPFCQVGDSGRGHFSYALDRPLWRCFGSCDKSGDWIAYLEERQGMAFQEALLFLAQAAGVKLEGPRARAKQAEYQEYKKRASLLETAQAIFREAIFQPAGQQVLQYCLDRGYTREEVKAMGLGAYVDRAGLKKALLQAGYTEEEIKSSGILLKLHQTGASLGETHQLSLLWEDIASRGAGLACRSILSREELKEKGWAPYLYSAGLKKGQSLVGFSSARGAGQVVLLEGVLDALYLNSLGLQTVAMGGTSLSPAQIKALERTGTEELILALDMDEDGQRATEKAILSLRASSLRDYVVSLPDGYKDPDEFVRAQGLEPFWGLMEQAERWPGWMARRMVSRHDTTTDRGLDKALDEALELYSQMEDGLERRDFWDTLRACLSLPEEVLVQKAEEKAQRASRRASRELLQATIRKVHQMASEGDVIGAELELEQAVQGLRTVRGVEPPEPYLLDDLTADILATSPGLRTDYSSLDEILRIPQGAITIVAGRPGHGKTTLLLNLLVNQVRLYPGRAFYYFSYEEARKFIALKLIMLMAGQVLNEDFNQGAYINYLKEKRGTNKDIEEAISKYQRLTEEGRLLISDSMPAGEDLAATIDWLAQRGETGAVFVDYIQKIPLQRPLQQRYLEIKMVSALLLQQAVQQDIPIILGAQLGRAKGTLSKVTLDNLRESGDIEQDSSLVIGLYNESVEETEREGQPAKAREVELKVSVLKQRGGVAGRSQVLTFDRPILRIKDTADLSWREEEVSSLY